MESSIGKLIYCCISKNNRILYSYNGGDHALETLASLCIENTPPFHSQYFHTAGNRTFGFLIDETLTYFAIIDDLVAANKKKLLLLLQQIKKSFKSSNSSGEELVPIIRRLICSLEGMNHSSNSSNYGGSDGSSSTKAPLLGGERKGSGRSEAVAAAEDVEVVIGTDSLMQKSLSFGSRSRQTGKKLWLRHAKIVLVVDAFFCLILFGIWLGICRGFRCVS